MTCKDCVHGNVCIHAKELGYDKSEKSIEIKCDDFQNEADFVNVVRCKDCRFWEGQKDIAQGLCLMRSAYPTGYWYCAYGIRKDEE